MAPHYQLQQLLTHGHLSFSPYAFLCYLEVNRRHRVLSPIILQCVSLKAASPLVTPFLLPIIAVTALLATLLQG